MREIVTIQVGGFANYIGSHFWNFQDELLGLADDPSGDPIYRNPSLNMDILYRTGETQRGILTYTPRLVSVDFQGSLGSLSSSGSLYNDIPSSDPSHIASWTGKASRHVSEPCKKNLFLQSLYKEEQGTSTVLEDDTSMDDPHGELQDRDIIQCLENGVQYWTDFSKVHYHPRSLYELNGLWTDALEFNDYGTGREALSGGIQGEEMNERLRFFIEECDHIQGIQFIVDDSGGFSSVAANFLENIVDDYPSTPVLLYDARGSDSCLNTPDKKSVLRSIHDAVSFATLSSFSKLIVPIGLSSLSASNAASFLCIDDAKPFHCSAVYAAAIHSVTLPFRMELHGPTADSNYVAGAVDVGGMVHMLADQARQNMVAILDVAMPAPPLTGKQKQRSNPGSMHSLTADVAEDVEDVLAVESTVIHGALHSGSSRASISQVKDSVNAAYLSSPTRPLFSHLSVALCPLPIPLPFPSIFGSHVSEYGELLASPIPGSQSRGSVDISSIPMAARLRSSSAILPYVQKRLHDLCRFGIDRGAPGVELLRRWGFQRDDVVDMGESLSKMVTALNPHSDASSSESD